MMKMMKKNAPSFLRRLPVAGLAASSVEVMQKLIIGLFVASCVVGNPGIEINVTQKGLDRLGGIIIKEMIHLMSGSMIPCGKIIDTNYKTIWIYVNCQKLDNVSIPIYKVQAQPGIGVVMAITEMQANMSGVLSYIISNRKHQQDPELMTILADGMNVTITIQLNNTNGYPDAEVRCAAVMQKLSIVFEPGSPSIISLSHLEPLLNKMLKNYVSEVLCRAFQGSLEELLAAYLNDFKSEVESNELDWAMTGDPVYGERSMKTAHKGQFAGDEEQFKGTNITTSGDGEVTIAISEEVFKSFLRSEVKYYSRSFEATLWPEAVRSLGLSWEKSGSTFLVTMKMKGEQDLGINTDGIMTKLLCILNFESLQDRKQTAYLDVEFAGTCSLEVSKGDLLAKQTNLRPVVSSEKIPEDALDDIREYLNEPLQVFISQLPVMKLPLPYGLMNSNTTILFNEHFIELVTVL